MPINIRAHPFAVSTTYCARCWGTEMIRTQFLNPRSSQPSGRSNYESPELTIQVLHYRNTYQLH